jgi:hypothetical protein
MDYNGNDGKGWGDGEGIDIKINDKLLGILKIYRYL